MKDADPNKEKLAMLGIETDEYLTSNQRELFQRINKTSEGKEETKENQETNSKSDNNTESDSKEKGKENMIAVCNYVYVHYQQFLSNIKI